jgi:hypothetical protein
MGDGDSVVNVLAHEVPLIRTFVYGARGISGTTYSAGAGNDTLNVSVTAQVQQQIG